MSMNPRPAPPMSTIPFTGKVSDFLKIGVTAAARGDLEAVRSILKAKPRWLHHVGSHGRTMLWEAAHRGKLEMVQYLVKRKADINACGSHYTPYFVEISCYTIARFKKHDKVADYLLEKGAKTNIHTAAFLGDCKAVRKYLSRSLKRLNLSHPQHEMGEKQKGDFDYPLVRVSPPWATPLCYALRGGDLETIAFLIDQGATIKGHERELFIAAKRHPERVKLLLENGADPNHAPEVLPDEGELYEIVSAHGAKSPKVPHGDDLVYLCRGDRGGSPSEVQRLLNLGADVNHQDSKGKTALHRASKAGFVETASILLDHGASVKIEDAKGETPLFEAVRSTIKNTENLKGVIKLLINSGADAHHANRREETPSMLAKKRKITSWLN